MTGEIPGIRECRDEMVRQLRTDGKMDQKKARKIADEAMGRADNRIREGKLRKPVPGRYSRGE